MRRWRSLFTRSFPIPCVQLLTLFLATSCVNSSALRYAQQGEHVSLKSELNNKTPKPAQARELSRAVLNREIEVAQDRQDRQFIRTLRGCSADLSSALASRAKTHDGVGAEAAMILLELDQLDGAARFASDPDGAWRALAARDSAERQLARQKYYLDPDERVRQAALLAAREANDETDIEHLLEVARLDPDPVTRSQAILTLGSHKSERASAALRDRFTDMDEALRLSVVQAWGTPQLYTHGGRRELERLISHRTGLEVVAAASILARDDTSEVRNPAITRLVRFMTEGTTDEQRLALMMMPVTSPETSAALLEKAQSKDEQIAIIAWSRLLAHPNFQETAEKELTALATSYPDSNLALQAEAALAAGGSIKVKSLLQKRLSDKDPSIRRISGMGLVRLGLIAEASPLIADDNAEVRRAIACRISAAPPKPVNQVN